MFIKSRHIFFSVKIEITLFLKKQQCQVHFLKNLLGGFLTQNPQSFENQILDEWDEKAIPDRLVFDSPAVVCLNLCLIDLGNRFRFILNEVEDLTANITIPNLPVE